MIKKMALGLFVALFSINYVTRWNNLFQVIMTYFQNVEHLRIADEEKILSLSNKDDMTMEKIKLCLFGSLLIITVYRFS